MGTHGNAVLMPAISANGRSKASNNEEVPLGIGYRRRGSKNYSDGATVRRKKFDDIFSRVDRIHQYYVTDGRTDTGDSKDRAYA